MKKWAFNSQKIFLCIIECFPELLLIVHRVYFNRKTLLLNGTISNTKVLLRDGINTAFGGPADLDVERNPEKVLDFH